MHADQPSTVRIRRLGMDDHTTQHFGPPTEDDQTLFPPTIQYLVVCKIGISPTRRDHEKLLPQ